MRIVAGKFRSRRLNAAAPAGVRPTSGKLRETIFNILGPSIEGAVFLDGCAGMGGIGIEALSRGAAMVYFVDESRKATRAIRENLQSLQVKEGYRILEMGLSKAMDLCTRDGVQFDIAFVDPPYEREELYEAALSRFSSKPLLASTGLLLLEHSKRKNLPECVGSLCKVRSLVQGDAALAFYRLAQ